MIIYALIAILLVVLKKLLMENSKYKIPEPFAIPILGNSWFCVKHKFDLIKMMASLKSYGGIARITAFGETDVFLYDKKYLEILFTSNSLLNHSSQYAAAAGPLGPESQLAANGEIWKESKKIMTHSFTGVPQSVFLTVINNKMKKLLSQLQQEATGGFIRFGRFLRRTQTAIIIKILLDEDADEKKEVASMFSEINTYFLHILPKRVMSPIHMSNLTFPFTKLGRLSKKIEERGLRCFIKEIRKKRDDLKELQDNSQPIPDIYIYRLLTKYGLKTDTSLAYHLTTAIAASYETTTSAAGFVLQMVAMHPDVQNKIYEEDLAIQREKEGEDLNMSDIQKYVYLDAVIKEALRLYPNSAVIGRSTTDDVQFGDYTVKKGTNVVAALWVTSRSEEYFEDPFKFNPDRFLESNASESFRYVYEPFSAGARVCPGRKLANMTLKVIVASLLRRYQIFSLYKSVKELDDKVTWNIAFHEEGDTSLRLVERVKIS